MAYTSGFTAVTGAVFTAAQYNTNVRDNFSAVWVYTSAGDIVYAASSTTLARLGIGAAGTVLKSTGSAPAWDTVAALLQATAMVASQAIGDLMYGNGAAAISRLGIGAAGKVLKSTGSAPAWDDITTVNACSVSMNSDLPIANATYVAINWFIEEYDTNSMHSVASNQDRITIVETGYYAIMFQAVFDVANAGLREALVQKNGTTTLWKVSEGTVGFARDCLIVSGIEYLTAGDYVSCKVWQNYGGALNLLYSSDGFPDKYAYTRFVVMKVNP